MEPQTLDVGGVERVYWLAPASEPCAPLLVVLHGTGLDGPRMAAWTGIAERGPAAGFAAVFPDAVGRVRDDGVAGRSDGVDDAAFVAALINRLVAQGRARAGVIVLVGLSNGASFAERLARHGLVASAGVVLVCGTAREASRRQAERPVRPIAVLCLAGTADPMLPWNGGRGIGPLAWMGRRRARRLLLEPGRREAVAPEVLAADCAAVNGCAAAPAKERPPMASSPSSG